jgi:hypothetical protein
VATLADFGYEQIHSVSLGLQDAVDANCCISAPREFLALAVGLGTRNAPHASTNSVLSTMDERLKQSISSSQKFLSMFVECQHKPYQPLVSNW